MTKRELKRHMAKRIFIRLMFVTYGEQKKRSRAEYGLKRGDKTIELLFLQHTPLYLIRKAYSYSNKVDKLNLDLTVSTLEDVVLTILKTVNDYTLTTCCSKTNNVVTQAGKTRRSLLEIYRLLRYYYKPVKINDLYNTLITLINKGFVYSWICSDINKRIYSYTGNNSFFNSEHIDEYLYDFKGKIQVGTSIHSHGLKHTRKHLKLYS